MMRFFFNWVFSITLVALVIGSLVYPALEREKGERELQKVCMETGGKIEYIGPQLNKLTCVHTAPPILQPKQ